MGENASEQGSSQSFSLTPGEVLLRYDPKLHQARAKGIREEETRPMLANRYFSVDNVELWKPSLLTSLGDACHRATYINGFHVLLCNRRLVLVGSNGRHLTFPPFEEFLNDAYAERISENCILVIVALTSEVHVALIGDCDGQRFNALQSVSCRTKFTITHIHHLKKDLFGLCCDNCTVESLSIKLSAARSPRPQLEASILASRRGWAQMALDYVSKERYVHSFFDHYKGYLLMLSNSRLSLWMYRDENHLHLESSVDVSKFCAVAVVAPSADQDEKEQIAALITSSGGCIPLYLASEPLKPSKAPTLALGELCNLPNGVTNTAVSLAVSCGTSLLLADHATASLVLSTQCERFCEAYHSSVSRVVSQLFLGKRICGVGAERRSGDGGDFVTFFVYCDDSTAVLIGRVPRGQLLRRQFSASVTNGVAALNLLDPVTRVDVLLGAALGGLPLQHVSDCLTPLLRPRKPTTNAAELSDGAKGIVRHTMRNLSELSRLCSSFQYWRLSEELAQSRSKLEKCCAVLTEVLSPGGWLDCPLKENWKWSSNFTVALSGEDISSRSAINAQAELLQLLLPSLKDAATIAWLYDMMLQSGLTYRFPGRLEDMLWKSDPSAIQITFCMDLLALNSKEVTERLVQSKQKLPQRCHLAATLLSLVLTSSFERVTAYVREHILDMVRCDLQTYANDVIEAHFPGTQARLLLLVYYYPHHRGAFSDIIALVERIDSAELLHRTLSTILKDPACDADLTAVVLDWMEGHSLADSRIPTFARVVVETNLDVDPAHTLAGRFFSSCKQAAAGHAQQASFRFGELARSELAVPLAGRLLSAEHAMQAMPSDVDRVTHFVLLLQQQLADLIDKHLQNGKDLLFARSSIESDLALLREHYLTENRLFELAGRYKALGGCSIQLDLLKIHPDSAQFTIANAITGALTFLIAVGLSATDAVRRVLGEYLNVFQAPLPLFPFVEFMAFDGQSPTTTIHELAAAGVQLPVLFDTFMNLLDGLNNPLFPIGETVAAVAQLVPKIDMSVQRICAAHLLECSRSLLDDDQRTMLLSDEDEALLREVGDEMRRLSQQENR
ncbi:hypothetical protein ABL78_5253 [Leptomonas seymouri]|uniref:Uncharacterized protein n=1 Tax=Leptomonas seymouri TaxID=5684 RepID=A0A0N1I3Q1_LEPSE|nr:hypothetical protein ABL78_5253 [Leptomonas seymouri]|eukprot:KPI85673.1 hypothetical protein ABL78_5253 [Leptomonas seymouri]